MGLFDKTPKYDIDLDKFEVSEPNHAEVFNKRVEKLVQSLEWMKENVFTKDRVLKSTDIQEDGYAMDGRILTEHLKNIVASFEKKLSEGLRKKVDSIEGKGLSANDFTDLLKDKLDGIAENANKYIHPKHKKYDTGLYKVTVDEEGHVISAEPITKEDITELGIPGQDTDTTYGLVSTEAAGLAPRRTGTTTKYLCDDGTWRTPPDTDTTYDLVSTEAAGLAPKRTGTETKYLCDDGTWKTPPDTDTTYGVVSKNAPGLVPKCTGTETKYLCDDGTWKVPPDTDTTYETGNTKTAGIGKLYTETGDSTDGSMTQKAISEGFAELNRKLPSDYYTESKSANISPNNWVTINSAVLKNGIYDVKANVSYSVSADVSIVLSIETDPYTNTVSVRGSMGGGGGLYVSNLIDARNRNITVNVKTLHVNSSVSEATSIFSYIRLC